jgi:Protein of unknown function (DUF938)
MWNPIGTFRPERCELVLSIDCKRQRILRAADCAVKSNLLVCAPRNFDSSLRQRNAQWGIRNIEQVVAEAQTAGLELLETVEMPANNLMVLFRKL